MLIFIFSFSIAQNKAISNYSKLRDNESLINKIDFGFFKFNSNQIYNYSLKKYQKITDYIFNRKILDGISLDFQYSNNLDKTFYSKIKSTSYNYSTIIEHSFFKYLSFKNRFGYKDEKYKVIHQNLDSLINNDGLYDSLNVYLNYNNLESHNNIIINGQEQTSYKEVSSENFYFFSLKNLATKVYFNFSKAIRQIPKQDFTQNKDEFSYNFFTEFTLNEFYGLSLNGKIVLDSVSNDFYKNHSATINKRIQKIFFHNFKIEYALNRNLKFFVEESFQRSNFKYFFDFDNFIYKNYNLKLALFWEYNFYKVEFAKHLEKDYFHYLSELNFNDNDQLRDFLFLKLSLSFEKFSSIIEVKNLRKKFVYISKYASINNYFNNRYSLSSDFQYKLNDNVTLIDSIYLASDYIYYKYVPEQNTAILIFDNVLGFNVKFSDSFSISIRNNFNRRDNGYYLANYDDKFYFYNNKLRKRNFFEINSNANIFGYNVLAYYNIRNTRYFRFVDTEFQIINTATEYSYGVNIMKKSSFMVADFMLGKQHYYGYDYWVLNINVGINF